MALGQKFQSLIEREAARLPLWLPVFLGLGVWLFFAGDAPKPYPLALGLAGLCVGMALWLRASGWRWAWWLSAMIFLGFTASALRMEQVAEPILAHELRYVGVEGVIKEVAIQPDKRAKLVLEPLWIESLDPPELPALVRISVRSTDVPLQVGDVIRMRANLFPPGWPAFAGDYDFARYFYFQHIGALGYVMGYVHRVQEAPAQSDWYAQLQTLRLKVGERVRSVLPGDEGAVTAALMNAEQSPISDATQEHMRASGLAHVLSISGLHLTIVAGVTFLVLRLLSLAVPVLRHRGWSKKIAAAGAILISFAYLALANFPVAAERSFVMVAFLLMAVMFDRQVSPLRSLGFAAFVILLIWPESIFSISFILSFAATLAILALAEDMRRPIVQFLSPDGTWWRVPLVYLAGVMATSFVAGMATLPFVMHQFQQINIYSLPANMLTSPIVGFWIMPGVMLSLALMPFGWDALVLEATGKGVEYMLAASAWVREWPHATLHALPMTTLGVMLTIIGGLWLCLWSTRMRWLGFPMIIIGALTSLQQRLPDMYIAGDAKMVTLRDANGDYVLLGGFEDHRAAKDWLEFTGQQAYPDAYEAPQNETHAWECKDGGCLITLGSQRVWLYRKKGDATCPEGLDGAIFMRQSAPANCTAKSFVLDESTIQAQGGTWLLLNNNQWEMRDVRSTLGAWPWHSAPAQTQ